MKNPAEQEKKQYEWLKPWQFKKGQSGNPSGAKRGKKVKTYLAERFMAMTDKEKDAFLNQISPDLAWRMAEGNPPQEVEHSGEVAMPFKIIIEKPDDRKQLSEGTENKDVPETI